MVWCRQARYRRSLSNFCSKRMQAPARCPVFDDVVSKHMALTRSATLQSCNRVYTSAAVFSPVPLVSFGMPSSLFTPLPDTRTGSRSTCSFPVRSCKSFPSQWTTSGTFTAKSFFIEAAKLARHPFRWRLMVDLLTVISAALQLKLKAASASIKVAFRSDILPRSKAAAKRGVMTMLRACLETGSEAVGATAEDKLFFLFHFSLNFLQIFFLICAPHSFRHRWTRFFQTLAPLSFFFFSQPCPLLLCSQNLINTNHGTLATLLPLSIQKVPVFLNLFYFHSILMRHVKQATSL